MTRHQRIGLLLALLTVVLLLGVWIGSGVAFIVLAFTGGNVTRFLATMDAVILPAMVGLLTWPVTTVIALAAAWVLWWRRKDRAALGIALLPVTEAVVVWGLFAVAKYTIPPR
jgi:hypothetical protein